MGSRKVVRPDQARMNGSVVRTHAGPTGAGSWYRAPDGSFKRRSGAALCGAAGSASTGSAQCAADGSVQRTTDRRDG
jgi:hypothetical protein